MYVDYRIHNMQSHVVWGQAKKSLADCCEWMCASLWCI